MQAKGVTAACAPLLPTESSGPTVADTPAPAAAGGSWAKEGGSLSLNELEQPQPQGEQQRRAQFKQVRGSTGAHCLVLKTAMEQELDCCRQGGHTPCLATAM